MVTKTKSKTRKPKAQKETWFKPGIPMGWEKTQSEVTRRRKALQAHKGDVLATARALQALANVTTDKVTKKLARADALYFYGRYQKEKGGK